MATDDQLRTRALATIAGSDRYGFTYYTVHEPYLDTFAPVIDRIRALGM